MKRLKHIALLVLSALLIGLPSVAEQCPEGYYNRINGASDCLLKGRLKAIIRKHTAIPYGTNTWEVFYYADRDTVTGECMDMYCDSWKPFTKPGAIVSGCNIEHSFAKSWWGGAENDAYKDCYHLNPSNSTANSSRSSYPLGVPVKDFKDASLTGSLRVGKMHHPTLNVDFYVFEPKDEYKGDFARAYFYMATCYGKDSLGQCDSSIFSGKYKDWRMDNNDVGSKYAMQHDNYLEFQDWFINLLLDWHRNDPVSGKELQRQDKVSDFQHNRNPFIDYPCLVEYIWGNRKGEKVVLSRLKSTTMGDWLTLSDSLYLSGCQCDYSRPILLSTTQQLTFPTTALGQEAVAEMHLIYALLPKQTLLRIEGDGAEMFAVEPTQIEPTQATYIDSTIRVLYHPTGIGTHSATLVVESPEVGSLRISLQGTCKEGCQVTWMVGGEETTDGNPTTHVMEGETIKVLPSGFRLCSKTFMGWTAQPIDGITDICPSDLFSTPDKAPRINRDTTFFAVFANHSIVGSGTPEKISASPASHTGWTISAGEKSTDKYWVLSEGAYIQSPEIDISRLDTLELSIRTYGGKQYNAVTVYFEEDCLCSLSGSSSTLHSYTRVNDSGLTGKGKLKFFSSTTTSVYGPGVSSVILTLKGLQNVYNQYTTVCGSGVGVEEVIDATSKVTKQWINGNLYILREGNLYNLQGLIIKNY